MNSRRGEISKIFSLSQSSLDFQPLAGAQFGKDYLRRVMKDRFAASRHRSVPGSHATGCNHKYPLLMEGLVCTEIKSFQSREFGRATRSRLRRSFVSISRFSKNRPGCSESNAATSTRSSPN